MYFYKFFVIGEVLEIAADGVFGDVELLAETSGEDLIVQVHLM